MGGKKEEKSTKTVQKQKKATVEDLTFGLKNKNKSKVVQKYVKEVNNKVMFSDVKVSHKSNYYQSALCLKAQLFLQHANSDLKKRANFGTLG